MARLLGLLLSLVRDWHGREFRRVRNTAWILILVPLALLAAAAFAGSAGWRYKLLFIEFELMWTAIVGLLLAVRRTTIGVEVATALAATEPNVERRFIGDVREAATDYVRFVAAVIASEMAAGFIVLWAPVHANFLLAILGLPLGMAFIAYAVWQKAELVWPKVVLWLTSFTLAAAIAALFFPYYLPSFTGEVASRSGRLDDQLTAFIRGEASVQTIFLSVVLLFVASWVLPALVEKERAELKKIWRVVPRFLAVAILAYWFIWGAGASAVGPYMSGAPGGVERKLTVVLKSPAEWVDIAKRLPARGVLDWDTRGTRDPWVKFSDGSTSPLRGNLNGRGDVFAVKGEGVLVAKWRE